MEVTWYRSTQRLWFVQCHRQIFSRQYVGLDARGVHPPFSQWCILHIPPLQQFINFSPISTKFTFVLLKLRLFCVPPNLTMMHLCVMLYMQATGRPCLMLDKIAINCLCPPQSSTGFRVCSFFRWPPSLSFCWFRESLAVKELDGCLNP